MQEGIYGNNDGDIVRGVQIFYVLMGEADYVAAVLRAKASQVIATTRNYAVDLSDDHLPELWIILQYSLQHMVTYSLRTYTPAETEVMVSLVDACILEAVEAALSIDFNEENMAEERLRLPARMKRGGIKKHKNMKRPAFLGAVLDIMPRCVDITEMSGEI
jgi:hypothetical protein